MSAQRMLEALEPAMMYADYRAGMSLSQVAAKWYYGVTTVKRRFDQRGYKLRSRHEGQLLRVTVVSEQEAEAS